MRRYPGCRVDRRWSGAQTAWSTRQIAVCSTNRTSVVAREERCMPSPDARPGAASARWPWRLLLAGCGNARRRRRHARRRLGGDRRARPGSPRRPGSATWPASPTSVTREAYETVDCDTQHRTETVLRRRATRRPRPAAPSRRPRARAGAVAAYQDCDTRTTALRGCPVADRPAAGSGWCSRHRTAWAGGARWYRCEVIEISSIEDDGGLVHAYRAACGTRLRLVGVPAAADLLRDQAGRRRVRSTRCRRRAA